MDWSFVLIIATIILTLLMFAGVPIVYSLGILALGLGWIFIGPKILYLFGTLAFGKVNSFEIVAVPLFIFMAEIIITSGAAKDAFDMLHKWFGFLPGGLLIASQMGCALFAAVCGASTATTAVIGGMAVPEMLKHKYDVRMAVGSIAAGGALGVLIPPSLLLIIYGILAEASIGQLFIGGIIPGIMLAAMRIVYFIVFCSIKPLLGPRTIGITWDQRLKSLWKILPLSFLALFVFVALYTGICTATEVAAAGSFMAMIITAAYRRLTWKNLREAFSKTAQTTCFVLWILVAASAFGYVLSYMQLPQKLTAWAVALQVPPYVIIIYINILLIILGCIMDPGAIIMVTVPILAPLVHSLGYDLVWFGVMFVVNMEVAEITPPLGLNLFVMKAVSPPSVTMKDIIIGSIPFMILDLVGIALVCIYPQLILWLPSKMIQ